MIIFKFAFYFFISFIILSIPLYNRPLFDHAYKYMRPTTNKIINYLHQNIELGLGQGEKTIKKIFSMEEDAVKSNQSALQKGKFRKSFNQQSLEHETPMGSYTQEEKLLLEKIIKSSKGQ